MIGILFVGCLSLLCAASAGAQSADPIPPPVPREFRGVWVATVDNIDWPSQRGLPVEQQKTELIAIMDTAARMNLNAVVLQVRPACDALFMSRLEPWSEYLTGEMGKAPEPFYDPLAFAVEEAHRRGLELHAWFNPYRARHPSARSALSEDHVSRLKPEITHTYGKHLWLDPGEKATQNHSLAVVMDVVRRYDIDGVHLDDYFYPYKERDASGSVIPFPDESSWEKYVAEGGKLARDDWRRENVNIFIRRLYREVKKTKPWVKVGISPFGIWRPGYPPQIQGFDQYAELYADARKWLINGWVDYFSPQLYWPIAQTAQSYPVLLKWWTEQNRLRRHLWPGNYTSRVGDGSRTAWPPEEIVNQVLATRREAGATGNVHFSMKAFLQNRLGLRSRLTAGPYARPALIPASPWLGRSVPGKPRITDRQDAVEFGKKVAWEPSGKVRPWLWVVQWHLGKQWSAQVLPGDARSFELLRKGPFSPGDCITVSAVSRWGNQGPAVIVRLP